MALIEVIKHAFLTTCHCQSIPILLLIPVPLQSGLFECAIKGATMPVMLGFSQSAIDIENHRF